MFVSVRVRSCPFVVIVFLASLIPIACAKDTRPELDTFARPRAELVSVLRREGIRDEDVLRVMAKTSRHLFVPENMRPFAYENHPLPIGHGQTISQPYIVAIMTELALGGRNRSKWRILEIGTGSGYQAAVLAELVKEVYTIEIVPELARTAKERLKKLGYRNVTVRTGDGYKGWPDKAPFDAIIVTAAPPSIPGDLVDQLRRGGRMIVPVGESPEDQTLALVSKSDTGGVSVRSLLPVRFVPMVHGDTE